MTRSRWILILGFMKTLISILGLISLSYSTLAFACDQAGAKHKTQYKVSAQIIRDGTVLSNPKIVTSDGEEAAIEQSSDNGSFLKLIVTPQSLAKHPDEVTLSMDFHHTSGNATAKYKSKMRVKDDGTELVVPMATENGHQYELHIAATRI